MEQVKVYKISDEAKLPYKGTDLSACYDICACFHQDTVKYHGRNEPLDVINKDSKYILLYPDDMALIPTGLIFCLPDSHHLKIYSRSGNVWKRKLIVGNQPAVIDSDYTNETYVLLRNCSMNVQKIKNGDRIAQIELCLNTEVLFSDISSEEFASFKINLESNRQGGLGSTGV
jgi:dUTP pyrophosphatase